MEMNYIRKMSVFIFSVTICTLNIVHCQITGIFSLDKFDENIECNIYFFKSGNYYLEFSENITSDIVESLVLSYGKFSLKGKEITLIDKVNNYQMKFLFNGQEIKALKSFKLILNKHFIISNSNPSSEPKFINSKINDSLSLLRERENNKQQGENLFQLNFGTYESEQGFKLNIQKNNRYELKLKNIVLSEGLWSRNGDELALLDSALNHYFYVLIRKNKLISNFLPGEYKGAILNLKSN